MELIEKYANKDYFYFVFRVFVGLLFLQHGLQKLFGMFGGVGGNTVPLMSLFGAAGLIEIIAGIAITLGLFTRLAAVISAIEMLAAYFIVHASGGLIPLLNQGELALLYFASFLILVVYGAGKWNVEKAILKKETF
ncbi:DoxX family protein [Candidatus Woesearchaeota archaeon]|nr:DoxX family protein [Candidatus Woesearchaeota archaeon]